MRSIDDTGMVSQDAQEVLLYWMDYSTYLEQGEELSDAGTFTVTPAGLTIDAEFLLSNLQQVRFRVAGGARGQVYKIEHQVDTVGSPTETLSKWFLLQITD